MPVVRLHGRAEAPVEEVWKLLFDPGRYPEWWAGVLEVRTDGPGGFTQWLAGYPDPLPQLMRTDRVDGRVTISCQVNDVEFAWRLAQDGDGTAIDAEVRLAEHEAHRAGALRAVLAASLPALAALAESESQVGYG